MNDAVAKQNGVARRKPMQTSVPQKQTTVADLIGLEPQADRVDARSQTAERAQAAEQAQALADSRAREEYAAQLLHFESDVRSITDERELAAHLCNSSRKVIPFQQSFYGTVKARSFKLVACSSVAIVDRNVPFNRWIEKIVGRLLSSNDPNRQLSFALPSFCDDTDEEQHTYPFAEFLWTPHVQGGKIVGGFLVARETVWTDDECGRANRLANLYVHSLAAIKGTKTLTKSKVSVRPMLSGCAVLTLMAGFIPVSITALAPVEVLPKEPFVLAAPFDGVVKEITAQQGQQLAAGDVVIVYDDVHHSNEKRLADQRAAIARARYERASQGAIADHRVKREIEVARAEYQLATAESDYATELLDQTRMKTPVPGIATFTDKRDWEGKPVSAGEAIVSVANPENVQFSLDLPVKDSIVLEKGAQVKIFLDSDPLRPLDAVLIDASYRAQPDKRDILSYTVRAELADDTETLPRIGVQGTAQVFGEKASLAYVIFRRPITAVRQYTGW